MLAESKVGKRQFLVDGFPRNRDNLDGWSRIMGSINKPTPNNFAVVPFVLFFDCSEEIMLARCLDRGKTSGRTDDNEASLRKRSVTVVII
jgi:UMP-CMP kinase